MAATFPAVVLRHPKVKRFPSDDDGSVDGTLVNAWASLKSSRAKDGGDEPPPSGRNGERQFRGEKRINDTDAATTDPGRHRQGPSPRACARTPPFHEDDDLSQT